MPVQSLSQKDSLERGMATHSSILAWEIPWTEEPGGLQSAGSQRVGHDLVTKQTNKKIDSMNGKCLRLSLSEAQALVWKDRIGGDKFKADMGSLYRTALQIIPRPRAPFTFLKVMSKKIPEPPSVACFYDL